MLPSPPPFFFAARTFALIAFTAVGGRVVRPALAAAFADAMTAFERPDAVLLRVPDMRGTL